jgi:TPR repeat protein
MHNVGYLYSHGKGVRRDQVAAVAWFRKAAERGFGPAMTVMGECYDQGLGVAVDREAARMWYRKAAAAGDAAARAWVEKNDR